MRLFSLSVLLGDAVVLAIVTISGLFFHMHSSLARLPYTFFPWLVVWTPVAASLRLFDPEVASQRASLKTVAWAAVLTAPLAALLRELLQGGDAILPIFVIIMALTTGLALLVWRGIYIAWAARHG